MDRQNRRGMHPCTATRSTCIAHSGRSPGSRCRVAFHPETFTFPRLKTQWLLERILTVYRCGGSVGIAIVAHRLLVSFRNMTILEHLIDV